MPISRPAQERGKRKQRPSAPDLCDVRCIDVRKVERVRREVGGKRHLQALADTFRLLGDSTRLRIAVALAREELCVCDIANVIGASQSVVSHSLRALRELRLVRYRKEGKIAYYRLDDDHITRLLDEGLGHVAEAERVAGAESRAPTSPASRRNRRR